jgi:hypothetical protein
MLGMASTLLAIASNLSLPRGDAFARRQNGDFICTCALSALQQNFSSVSSALSSALEVHWPFPDVHWQAHAVVVQ